MQNIKPPFCLYSWADRFESYLVETPKDRFSQYKAQMWLSKKIHYGCLFSNENPITLEICLALLRKPLDFQKRTSQPL